LLAGSIRNSSSTVRPLWVKTPSTRSFPRAKGPFGKAAYVDRRDAGRERAGGVGRVRSSTDRHVRAVGPPGVGGLEVRRGPATQVHDHDPVGPAGEIEPLVGEALPVRQRLGCTSLARC
jgi:hypothetical protein